MGDPRHDQVRHLVDPLSLRYRPAGTEAPIVAAHQGEGHCTGRLPQMVGPVEKPATCGALHGLYQCGVRLNREELNVRRSFPSGVR